MSTSSPCCSAEKPNGIRRDFPLPSNGIKCQDWVVAFNLKPLKGEVLRAKITRVGADLAKRVIQVHAVDASGKLVTNRALARDKFILWCAQLPAGCLVGTEASSGAHHWARKLVSLDHRVKLGP